MSSGSGGTPNQVSDWMIGKMVDMATPHVTIQGQSGRKQTIVADATSVRIQG